MPAGNRHPDYTLLFSKRSRRLRIKVSPAGVSVTAPVGTKPKLIDSFVRSRSEWILEKLTLFDQNKGPSSQVPLEEGAILWFFGREVTLSVIKEADYPFLRNSVLYVQEEWLSKKRITEWLDQQLLARAACISDQFSKATGLFPQKIRVGSARTRWGSCSSRGVVMINRKLVHAPVDVIKYVLLHELTHLKHRNHSSLFWNALEEYMGEVKNQKKWLRLQGAYLL